MEINNKCPDCGALLLWRGLCCEQAQQVCSSGYKVDSGYLEKIPDATCYYESEPVEQQIVFDLVNQQTKEIKRLIKYKEDATEYRLEERQKLDHQIKILERALELAIEETDYIVPVTKVLLKQNYIDLIKQATEEIERK